PPFTGRNGPGRTARFGPSNLRGRGMGLLDDAIREHLELKRRHGADPDEATEASERPAAEEPATAAAPERGAEMSEIAEPPEMPGEPEPDPDAPPAGRAPEPGDEE